MSRFQIRVAALVRIVTGAAFAALGYGKVTGAFVHGAFAQSAVEMQKTAFPFWTGFLRSVVVPHASFFGWAVALGELAVGLGLLLGLLTRAAATCGALLTVTILLGQAYVPGSSWDAWLTVALTTKFVLLLLILLAVSPAGQAWALDTRISKGRTARK